MKKTWWTLLALAALPNAWAQTIYKGEKNGVTIYSSQPQPGSASVKLPELSVVPSYHPPAQQAPVYAPSMPSSVLPNGVSLPPPPPSLAPRMQTPPPVAIPAVATPVADAQPRSDVRVKAIADTEAALESARKDLTAQEEIRFGDEKNYQKKLDRVKPYQDRVLELEARLQKLKAAN